MVTDLVDEQLRCGTAAVVACDPDLPQARVLRAAGATVLDWRASRNPGPASVRETREVAHLVRLARPDVVHAHSAKAGLAARLALRGRVPTVFQPHAWSFAAVEGPLATATVAWERLAARWCERIVCVSEAERLRGQEAGIAGRWEVIPNGVDLRRFHPPTTRQARHAARPTVVCVGRLCRQKGQDVLLAAWPRVLREVPGARLVLVGGGEGQGGAGLAGAGLAGVEFAGDVADVLPVLHRADLLVLPSRWEGMALAPLEAMACGLPVVVTDVDGARESLPPGHEDRCLVPPEDPEALAGALVPLLRSVSLRSTLGRQAYEHARASFDVRRTAEAVLEVYRQVTSETAGVRDRKPSTEPVAARDPQAAPGQLAAQNERPAPGQLAVQDRQPASESGGSRERQSV